MQFDKPEYSKKDVWWIVTKTSIAVFTLAMIYAEFKAMQQTIITLEERMEYTNTRVDKKTERNKEYIDQNTSDIKELQIPGTDE